MLITTDLDVYGADVYRDHQTGEGYAVLPDPAEDVCLTLAGRDESVQCARLAELARWLDREGWEFTLDEFSSPMVAGHCQRRPIVGLFGREPMCSEPAVEECAEASSALLRQARHKPRGRAA